MSLSATFRRSGYSQGKTQNCVEVADTPTGAALRDSKHPDAGHLAVPDAEWAAFLTTTAARGL